MGGGAAGLATAIFAARCLPRRSIFVLDGARKLGAKILVSGGGRCNVTNRVVTNADFCGGSPHVIKRVLAALPVERTVAFFRDIGVEFYEEADNGKYFPTTDRARTVLDALLGEATSLGVSLRTEHRVTDVRRMDGGFEVQTDDAAITARRVVLAAGGRSLPKSGSDGSGFALAARLGHSLVTPTPALVPLVLDGDFHVPLSGISQPAEFSVRAGGGRPVTVCGVLLWTHFGVSGPGAMDMSRHWHRARLDGADVSVTVNFAPGESAEDIEAALLAMVSSQPKMQLHNALARFIPARLAQSLLSAAGIDGAVPMAHMPKRARQAVARCVVGFALRVRNCRGWNYAEATAGGVPLGEVDPRSLESRKCPGLFFAGEILDVDGRIGGFNFQWAWSSARVVANAFERQVD